VFVNDERAKQKLLSDGDLIVVGSTRMYVGLL